MPNTDTLHNKAASVSKLTALTVDTGKKLEGKLATVK